MVIDERKATLRAVWGEAGPYINWGKCTKVEQGRLETFYCGSPTPWDGVVREIKIRDKKQQKREKRMEVEKKRDFFLNNNFLQYKPTFFLISRIRTLDLFSS